MTISNKGNISVHVHSSYKIPGGIAHWILYDFALHPFLTPGTGFMERMACLDSNKSSSGLLPASIFKGFYLEVLSYETTGFHVKICYSSEVIMFCLLFFLLEKNITL